MISKVKINYIDNKSYQEHEIITSRIQIDNGRVVLEPGSDVNFDAINGENILLEQLNGLIILEVLMVSLV